MGSVVDDELKVKETDNVHVVDMFVCKRSSSVNSLAMAFLVGRNFAKNTTLKRGKASCSGIGFGRFRWPFSTPAAQSIDVRAKIPGDLIERIALIICRRIDDQECWLKM